MKRISLIFAIVSALILSLGISAWADGGSISVASVKNLIGTSQLNTKTPNYRFVLQFNNTTGIKVDVSNGWEVYSPDGALFSNVTLDTLGPMIKDLVNDPPDPDKCFARKYFDVAFGGQWHDVMGPTDPTTPDTVGFLGAGSSGNSKQYTAGKTDTLVAIMFDGPADPATNDGKHICIDTAFWGSGGTWVWVANGGADAYYPSFNGAPGVPEPQLPGYLGGYCFAFYNVPNLPPTVVKESDNCGPSGTYSISGNYCSTFTFDFKGCDPEAPVDQIVAWQLTGAPAGATIDANGVFTWNTATLANVGASIAVQVQAKDNGSGQFGPAATLNIAVTNAAPVITTTCPVDGGFMSTGGVKTVQFAGTDDCGVLNWSVVDDLDPATTVSIDNAGLLSFSSTAAGVFSETVTLSDGALSTTCVVTFTVSAKSGIGVTIEKTHLTLQGQFEYVDVSLDYAAHQLGGFNLLISYDNSALSLQEVLKGTIYSECGWEYFTYRFGADGNCTGGCPSGLVRVVGIAETNNGNYHPTCFNPTLPATLFTLKFLVSNDRTLECQYAPVRFFWLACEDNTVSDKTGDTLYIANRVYDYHDIDANIAMEPPASFPSYSGVPLQACLNTMPNKPNPIRDIDFYDGGVDIACADSIDARGDINLNGLGYEIADAVLFSRYFVYGLGVFTINQGGQIAATDANADGLTLTVADLVYLIKVVVGDKQPYVKVAPVEATYTVNNGVVSVDASMGAALIVVKGNVTPTNLSDMSMLYNFDGTNTRVLVYPNLDTKAIGFSGNFVNVHGEVVSIEMATATGAPVVGKLIPSNFGLSQNYPNPFNPTTKISFALPKTSDYNLTIYNVTGQKVAEFSGTHEAGNVEIEWNASGNASGVYFYKLNAGTFSATKKMVLLK